jgi:hypothetical protein
MTEYYKYMYVKDTVCALEVVKSRKLHAKEQPDDTEEFVYIQVDEWRMK